MTFIVSVLLCFLTLYVFWTTRMRMYSRYPPGPWGIPLLGNVFQLPTLRKPWHTLAKWKTAYGPIVYLNMAGQPMIILNTKKVVEDLLDRRTTKYSDRPSFVVGRIMTGNMNFALISTGERWRKMRRASDNALGLKNTVNYHGVQRNEAVFSTHSILSDPDNWRSHVDRRGGLALSLVYDLPLIQSVEDPSIQWMNHHNGKIVASMMPGAHLVEVLPFLQHLPRSISKWRRAAEESFEEFSAYFERKFQNIKKQVATGQEQRPSFCVSLAENQEISKLSDQECSWLAGVLYSAAQETTATTMMWFMFSMILFPRAQTRAQEELDKVVGRSRLPSFADLKHLPYIHAIVKEILRWRTPLPLGVPHVTNEDDYYDGYYIPKGTICIPNAWSLNHDPDIYGPDAEEFRPERHLDENGQLKDGLLGSSEGHYTYGFGQRICSGRHFANNSLFILVATILWTMRLEGVKDSDGNVVVPVINAEEEHGILSRPPLFAITATPRFRDADTFIREARDEVVEENLARLNTSSN
ncbi:hypothetical protein D9758_005053 [Tetrapyrgos nigripes]|uniref:Cytochrome P450 n=1 Tax=Tetrapyrgos nigripes TaxID=182062 RepID=A0A8H5GWA4_9AGAR|nr:hypothetical protein D9758_005053 [Tetrapyrgos nigripes]